MRPVKLILVTIVLTATAVATAIVFVLPRVIGHEVRERLAEAGYPDAELTVGAVTLDRVELLAVTLAPGLALGDVELSSGPYALWRGEPVDVVLRGPRVHLDAVTERPRRPGGDALRRVTVDAGELVSGADRIAVRGTIDLRTTNVDLVAEARELHAGDFTATNVAATVRGPIGELRACATGLVEAIRIEGCLAQHDDAADLVWQAHHAAWDASGTAALRLGDAVSLRGRADVRIADTTLDGVEVGGATLRAEVEADLSAHTFVARGDVHADELRAGRVTIAGASMPFEISGIAGTSLALRGANPLAIGARSASIDVGGSTVHVDRPSAVVAGTIPLGRVGQLQAGPREDDFEVTIAVRDVPLATVVAATTRTRVAATGTIDGTLVLASGDDGLELVGGRLDARGPGTLRVRDAAKLAHDPEQPLAIHRRIASALADFHYARMSLSVERDPDLRLSLAGRGGALDQELAIDVTLRGVLARNQRQR